MLKASPFCIENHLGKLQLTKGNFLALQKRKQSTLRTLAKTKHIAKDPRTLSRDCKQTVKRTRQDEVGLTSKEGEQVVFAVVGEGERLRWRMKRSLPLIEMSYDNDEESEWSEINDCVHNLSLSLSLATFDNHFQG